MERTFKREIAELRKGAGEVFEGEGILAITKALLQSGVSYLGGYQGAPVSHLTDVMAQAGDLLDEFGIHFETCTSEAAAAAMCAASINYPMRGAVVWKSTVGTNVASDALSNLASAGVKGGTLIVLGEDYGEGASIIQERTHAYAMKSAMWLMDPRPNHPSMVDMIERGFELSEASNTPVMVEFRIRACHMTGRFTCRDNRKPAISRNDMLSTPEFDYGRICMPPSTYSQEQHKIHQRRPAAIDFIRDNKLNETFPGELGDIGIITQGGLYNSVIGALQQHGLADAFGKSRVPIFALNVTYPLVPEEISRFCAGKSAVLVVEESQPEFLEQAIGAILRKTNVSAALHGKDVLPMAGEYTQGVLLAGLAGFLDKARPTGVDLTPIMAEVARIEAIRGDVAQALGAPVPARPPGFCTGCPERPVFSAIKLVEKDIGKIHVAADVGCHTFGTLPPFNTGNTMLGYGLGLASAAAVGPAFDKRTLSIMGDGGFWHNGLTTGVTGAVFNNTDSVLVIMNNGYTSATGQQALPSSSRNRRALASGMSIESALKGVGVKWRRTVRTYDVRKMMKVLKEAMTTPEGGLKVIVAESECQLARQRRIRPLIRDRLAKGRRVVRTRFGVDPDTCTGDHSCIRLSGCPTLTVRPNPDPLRKDPIAHVEDGCVGCGLCGEVAEAAALCPSFYRAEIIQNANAWDRLLYRVRRAVIVLLEGPAPKAAS